MVLVVVGFVLVIFGAIWISAIFPQINKVPANLEISTQQVGTVTLLDEATLQPVTYNVIGTRAYKTIRCCGDVIYLEEDCSFVDADTDQPLPSLHSSILLAIDRVERDNVPGCGDRDRVGYWSFPRDVKADVVYPFWITGNPTTVDAIYIGEEDFEGMPVLVYELQTPEEGLTIPAGVFTPEMQLYQWIMMKVEPVTGTAVYFESTNRRTSVIPVPDEMFPNTGPMTFTEVTVYEDDLVFTQETVDQLVHDAKFYRWGLPWGSTYINWLNFGLGAVLIVFGVVLLTRRPATVPVTEPSRRDTTGSSS